ncbi:GTP cyclohydrolase II [Campylobacter sp. Cr9]|uniref:GTP cyclohydrolase II n=1 Tax=unclassified Campylobacter TaxID=2593542 RepID=UPI001EFBF7BC|nr:GTP cyclohydrolase II [Campylobacter sp. RM5004]MBZ7985285.1 GTP cyclohydrolase II [Campylobacter sp. Cr9]ULO00918.1 GTP cyclohydrolase II [Campylobacter sp. RM5004]
MKVEVSKQANLPTRFGNFIIQSFKENDKEHLVIMKGEINDEVNVRIHSECLTGDALGSLKCDCRDQLKASLRYIEENGGMVIYLRQEGRGIGLFNKVNAYNLQDSGLDTLEANLQLGFKDDERDYKIVDFILEYYKIKSVKLLTNNPLKLKAISKDVKRIPLIMKSNDYNKQYLKVKSCKMGHMLNE